MKRRNLLSAAAIFAAMALALPATAQAACSYNGINYSVGSKLCFGGWLQECTVANYWKAIGMCKNKGAEKRGVDQQPVISTKPVPKDQKKKAD